MSEQNKKVCYAVMTMHDARLTSQARYFLIRMLYLYGANAVDLESLKSNRDFGLSNSTISKACELLMKNKYLEWISGTMQPNQRGRPKKEFAVNPELWKKWISDSPNNLIGKVRYAHLIDDLLFETNKIDVQNSSNQNSSILSLAGKKKVKLESTDREAFVSVMKDIKKNNLSPATRILLATLYLRADDCGVVRNLGTAELLQLTGMDRESLSSQFEKIKQLGYLLERVPGLTGVYSLGRVSSVFYLNTLDERVGFQYRSILLMRDNSSDEPRIVSLSINPIKKWGEAISENSNGAGINEHEDRRYIYYLQYKVSEYASELLRRCWSDLDDVNKIELAPEDLLLKIGQEIYPKELRVHKNHDNPEKIQQIESAVKVIYPHVLRVAIFYKKFILDLFEGNKEIIPVLDTLMYSIIPISPVKSHKLHTFRWAIVLTCDNPIFRQSSMLIGNLYSTSEQSSPKIEQLSNIIRFFKKPIVI